MHRSVTLLGSTGSIGVQVLDVIRALPERFTIKALAAGRNLERLAQQVAEFQPECVSIERETDLTLFKNHLKQWAPGFKGEITAGPVSLNNLACRSFTKVPAADTLIVGLVGLIGLEPSLTALKLGKTLITANKETFVTGGHLVKPYLDQIIPMDSEHVAIHQCLFGQDGVHNNRHSIQTLYLTASGGPFRGYSQEAMAKVSLAETLQHPNWVMGRKITVDSATMMNKGLEVIEAHWLFDVPYERIQVVVHPESLIHSGVAFVDGAILLQMGAPDMHGPIQYAMTYPDRLPYTSANVALDLLGLSNLRLEAPDPHRFPCLQLAYDAGKMGSSATVVLNGADEMAVQLFLEEKIQYKDIFPILEKTLAAHQRDQLTPSPSLSDIVLLDAWAREFVQKELLNKASTATTSSELRFSGF